MFRISKGDSASDIKLYHGMKKHQCARRYMIQPWTGIRRTSSPPASIADVFSSSSSNLKAVGTFTSPLKTSNEQRESTIPTFRKRGSVLSARQSHELMLDNADRLSALIFESKNATQFDDSDNESDFDE